MLYQGTHFSQNHNLAGINPGTEIFSDFVDYCLSVSITQQANDNVEVVWLKKGLL